MPELTTKQRVFLRLKEVHEADRDQLTFRELADELGISASTLLYHVDDLRNVGLVERDSFAPRKDASPEVMAKIAGLTTVGRSPQSSLRSVLGRLCGL